MRYTKKCDIKIDCFTKDTFFDNKKKNFDIFINMSLNEFLGTRNSFTNQVILLKVNNIELFVSLHEIENAIKLLKDLHNAGN